MRRLKTWPESEFKALIAADSLVLPSINIILYTLGQVPWPGAGTVTWLSK